MIGTKLCWLGLATTLLLNRINPELSIAGVVLVLIGAGLVLFDK